ncbi:DUF533 domain-containing protein [Algimonas porphyrae]|uniref:Protein YebE n=1 Tax=Algimonas porphyrae TaxID=1128113 RepID=A0ABQ5UX07_9PROT|nr:DUF533 domain-containing protein [Algimonas porphyrae]GLQ19255.1 protein YebE [Algimonas porphyrae]
MPKELKTLAKNPEAFLAELLGSGRALLDSPSSRNLTEQARDIGRRGEDFLIDKLGMEDNPDSREQIRQQAKYAGIAGALALLLKSKSTRKMAALGGLAALGTIAYKGHQRGRMPSDFNDAIGMLTGKTAERRANMLLRAMIAAARADGVIDDDEAALIEAYPDADVETLRELMARPDDPVEIAALATSEQCAAEIYAVSARIADGINPAERDYLDRLAMALRLDPEAAALIETEVRNG